MGAWKGRPEVEKNWPSRVLGCRRDESELNAEIQGNKGKEAKNYRLGGIHHKRPTIKKSFCQGLLI